MCVKIRSFRFHSRRRRLRDVFFHRFDPPPPSSSISIRNEFMNTNGEEEEEVYASLKIELEILCAGRK